MSSFPLSITQKADPKLARNTANFAPNFWGDCFLTYIPDDTVTHACKEKELEGLKKKEIEDALKVMYETYNLVDDNNDDLASAALRFRLLRQGYHIPSGKSFCPIFAANVFKKFKDEEGNFKESLVGDLRGMLALYEATYLMVHGEDILDEAQAFTTAHLQSMAPDSDNPLKKQVVERFRFCYKATLCKGQNSGGILLDDIYDAHGTFEELKLFAEAIERWDASSIDQLPDYMKLCYQALLDVFEEIEEEMTKQEKPYRVHYAKQAVWHQCPFF
ncbi:Valencene synthase [Vitis vinifera]|uniref:Valencene synthase n=1 Tax=Vitis vinifera TaxID=29760 RepID=A0A438CFB8_VITVI|nr:Valencene synthase [Vitis vinifera]